MHEYSPEARQYYIFVESVIDIAFPIVYSFFLAIVLVLLYRKSRYGVSTWVAVLPFGMLLFDFTENYFIIKLLTQFPMISDLNIQLCEIAKLMKWSILFIIVLLIINGLLRNTLTWLSHSKD